MRDESVRQKERAREKQEGAQHDSSVHRESLSCAALHSKASNKSSQAELPCKLEVICCLLCSVLKIFGSSREFSGCLHQFIQVSKYPLHVTLPVRSYGTGTFILYIRSLAKLIDYIYVRWVMVPLGSNDVGVSLAAKCDAQIITGAEIQPGSPLCRRVSSAKGRHRRRRFDGDRTSM